MFLHETNYILLKLEKDGFTTPDEKAKELIKELAEAKHLYALKLLFEDFQNKFSSKVLTDSLFALADPASFNLYYSKESVTMLELHLRAWIAILEKICFFPIRLTKELRDTVYNSLTKFAGIHKKTTQLMEEIKNSFDSKDDKNAIKMRNYNIDFLLIHLRDTLYSLRDEETEETWFQESLRRTRDVLKNVLSITSFVGAGELC